MKRRDDDPLVEYIRFKLRGAGRVGLVLRRRPDGGCDALLCRARNGDSRLQLVNYLPALRREQMRQIEEQTGSPPLLILKEGVPWPAMEMDLENRISSELRRPKRPPRLAEFALMLIPRRSREHLVGDLEEEFRTKMLPEYGRFFAWLWYWEQTVIAVGCYVWPVIKRLLGLPVIWKVMGG